MTPMTLIELRAVRDALRRRLTELDRITPTCWTCASFKDAPRCDKHGAVPEEFQRAEGACQDWVYDGVPF